MRDVYSGVLEREESARGRQRIENTRDKLLSITFCLVPDDRAYDPRRAVAWRLCIGVSSRATPPRNENANPKYPVGMNDDRPLKAWQHGFVIRKPAVGADCEVSLTARYRI
jgi:hypothetical protein